MKAKIILAVLTMLLAGFAAAEDKGIAWENLSEEQQQVLQRFEADWGSFAAERQPDFAVA